MQKIECRFTVFFEDPFWVGVYERVQDQRLEASRIVFGPQPKDCQVYEYLLRRWQDLPFSQSVCHCAASQRRENPKRVQREITRSLGGCGTGTKSQEALSLQREQLGQARRKRQKQNRELEKQRKFQLRQQKKKEKKKGR